MMQKRIFIRTVWLASACLLAATASVSTAADFGVRGGAYTEEEEAFLGAEALFGVGGSKTWFGNPNVEHAFIDDGDLTTASFDFHYDFLSRKDYSVWAGAGPTLIFKDGDAFAGNDDTDAGVNLLMGVGATQGAARPYGQMKVIVSDDTQAVLAAGVRF
jgi:hypothetical protein